MKKVIERYIEIAGKVLALYIGTVSIDMIMSGMDAWLQIFRQS